MLCIRFQTPYSFGYVHCFILEESAIFEAAYPLRREHFQTFKIINRFFCCYLNELIETLLHICCADTATRFPYTNLFQIFPNFKTTVV